MFLLYCDETNLERRSGDFFVYGGVAIPCESAKSLSDSIESIRSSASIPREFLLKFNPKPNNLSHEEFRQIKESIITSVEECGCKIFVSAILHDIAKSSDEARRNEINRVLYHFDLLLQRNNDYGLVLIDRFSDKQLDAHLREKFASGLKGMPYSNNILLRQIMGYHYSAIGQSHFSSMIDIVICSLRFAINAFTREDASRDASARTLLHLLSPLFDRNTSTNKVSEVSMFFSPKVIKSEGYREKYIALKKYLGECTIDCEQEISEQRTY